MTTIDVLRVITIVDRMRINARIWHDVSPEEKARLVEDNRAAAEQLNSIMSVPVVYKSDGGTWHVGSVDGPLLFDLY